MFTEIPPHLITTPDLLPVTPKPPSQTIHTNPNIATPPNIAKPHNTKQPRRQTTTKENQNTTTTTARPTILHQPLDFPDF